MKKRLYAEMKIKPKLKRKPKLARVKYLPYSNNDFAKVKPFEREYRFARGGEITMPLKDAKKLVKSSSDFIIL